MKLRIRGDSLRLRLTRGEVRQLRETGSVIETLHLFGGATLDYELRVADVEAPVASFADHDQAPGAHIVVRLPQARAHAWADGDEVGIAATQPLETGSLALLIEKDFACLAPRDGEQDADTFPNPDAESGLSC